MPKKPKYMPEKPKGTRKPKLLVLGSTQRLLKQTRYGRIVMLLLPEGTRKPKLLESGSTQR